MRENRKKLPPNWTDDGLAEWTDDQIDRAELRVAGKVVRPASGTLTKVGRPPLGDAPKKQVTLRLDADVIDRFRASGKGWQSRINQTLRKAAGV